MPIAGPSAPIQGRVDWQQRLEQGFQTRHNRRLQNYSHVLPDQTRGAIIESQQVMGQQERYAEEERLHTAHLGELWRQHEEHREREQQAHLTEVVEAEQQQINVAQQQQINVAQQQQIIHQQEAEHVQQVMANNQASRALPVA